MNLQEAISIISGNAPCPHDSVDTSLGNGKIWAKCEDCGATIEQESLQRFRDFAGRYDDALEVLLKVFNATR